MPQRFGEAIIVNEFGKTESFPTYCCGHCSDIVMMRYDRKRERVRCKGCGNLICETKPICREQCTPIHALAHQRFDTVNKKDMRTHGKLVDAIMNGCNTIEEAHARNLIIAP